MSVLLRLKGKFSFASSSQLETDSGLEGRTCSLFLPALWLYQAIHVQLLCTLPPSLRVHKLRRSCFFGVLLPTDSSSFPVSSFTVSPELRGRDLMERSYALWRYILMSYALWKCLIFCSPIEIDDQEKKAFRSSWCFIFCISQSSMEKDCRPKELCTAFNEEITQSYREVTQKQEEELDFLGMPED